MSQPISDPRPYILGVQSTLRPGEKILWVGAPPARVTFHYTDLLRIPLAVIWLLFAGWMAFQASATGGIVASLFIIFAVVGGFMLLPGRLILDAIRRSKTGYALTDERLLIVSTFPFRLTISLPLLKTELGVLTLEEDGSATIEFGPTPGFAPSGYIPVKVIGFSIAPPLRLEAIPDAQRVYDSILAAQASILKAA
jgi:hypothetical protein